jgi:aminoglycoside phosphotransferase (APT) family kinase protein
MCGLPPAIAGLRQGSMERSGGTDGGQSRRTVLPLPAAGPDRRRCIPRGTASRSAGAWSDRSRAGATAQAAAPGARITQAAGLRDGGNPWLLRPGRAGKEHRVVPKTGDPASARDQTQLRTQVAALAPAQDRSLPAPRVIAADPAGHQPGALAMVTSVLPGSSTIPQTMPAGRTAPPGVAAAAIHAAAPAPQPDRPARTRPLPDADLDAWRRSAATTPLLARAEQQVSKLPVPGGAMVLVHRDLWQGNTMWCQGGCTGVLDRDRAGTGTPGTDPGTPHPDAALHHGPAAAGQIPDGRRPATGRQPEHVAYRDLVAALTTVGDTAQCTPPLLDHHRPDLHAPTLTPRRDAFLSAALTQLDARCRACATTDHSAGASRTEGKVQTPTHRARPGGR